MEKRKIYLFASLFAAAALCGFTSCGDDNDDPSGDDDQLPSTSTPNGDDDDDDPSGDDGQAPSTSIEEAGIAHTVYSIDYGWDVSYFNYDGGRMVNGFSADYGSDFLIKDNPFSIVIDYAEEDYEYEEVYSNIRTDSRGFVTSCDYYSKDVYEGETDEDRGTMTVEYSDDGHLLKIKASYDYLDDEPADYDEAGEENEFTFTWTDGNLTGMRESYVSILKDGSREDEEVYEYTFEYGENAPTNSGIFTPDFIMMADFVYYAGYMGKTTKNIPLSVTERSETGAVLNTDTYRVEYDSEGRISVLHRNNYKYATYGYTPYSQSVDEQASLSRAGKAVRNAMKLKNKKMHRN